MIKFHRPVHECDIKEGDTIELDPSYENMYVSQNFANYVEADVTLPKVRAEKATNKKELKNG